MHCPFCDKTIYEKEGIIRNKTCIFLSGGEYNPEGVLVGAGIIIPFVHRETPFELTSEEIIDMFSLLNKVKKYLDKKYNPDGYSLGWNIGKVSGQVIFHSHLHIMPRYNDEPLAGKGIRYFLKQADNSRIKK
jgi:histidine triad (HIT) family protein